MPPNTGDCHTKVAQQNGCSGSLWSTLMHSEVFHVRGIKIYLKSGFATNNMKIALIYPSSRLTHDSVRVNQSTHNHPKDPDTYLLC